LVLFVILCGYDRVHLVRHRTFHLECQELVNDPLTGD